jgi:hypothetical protein
MGVEIGDVMKLVLWCWGGVCDVWLSLAMPPSYVTKSYGCRGEVGVLLCVVFG